MNQYSFICRNSLTKLSLFVCFISVFLLLFNEEVGAQNSGNGTAFDVRSESEISWLPGEGWDPLTGKLSYHTRDLVFQGNTGLPIILSRTYRNSTISDGQVGYGIDVPTLHHNDQYVGTSENCNDYYSFEGMDSNHPYAQRQSGIYFVYGRTQIHFFDYALSINASRFPTEALLVSPDNWYITCENNSFHVHSNDGMTYNMGTKNGLPVMLVSEVSDRFGNTLTYSYATYANGSRRLSKIESNDGRELNFTSTSNNLVATSNGSPKPHKVTYFYGDSKVHVRREDNKTTRYQYDSDSRIIGVRFPTQGLVNYTYHPGTSEVDQRTVSSNISGENHLVRYDYTKQDHGDEHSWVVSTPLVKYRYRVRKSLIDEDNIGQLSGNVAESQGKLIRFEQFKNDGVPLDQSVPHLKIDYVYQKDNSLADVVNLVNNYSGSNYPKSWVSLFHAWKSRIKTTTSHMTLDDGSPISATRTIESRDHFGRPKKIVESGTAGSRTITLSYEDKADLWVTGLLTDRKVFDTNDPQGESNPTDRQRFTYDTYGRVHFHYDNNIPTEYTYDDSAYPKNALVIKTTDGQNRSFTYDNHYRGLPQTEGRIGKNGNWEYKYRVVSSDGTVASESRWGDDTSLWTYEYDAMRWVKKVTSPRTETSPIEITWTSANHRKSTQGRLTTETRYDGFGRVVFEGSQDTDTLARINRFSRYDEYGRLVFHSIASSTSWTDYLANNSGVKGTTYQYDHFDRLTLSLNSGTIGTLDYHYDLNGSANVQSIDRNTHGDKRKTTTYYQYYGDFNTPVISKITDGNGISTDLTYDVAGKITQTVRDGITRSYHYNANAQLDNEHHPETGGTYYFYHSNGLLSWISDHSDLASATQKTHYQYDLSNRLKKIRYGNGVGQHYVDQSYFYDVNGNIEQITSDGATSSDWVSLEYDYDEEENLLSETLKVDGQQFTLSYLYDDLSALRQRTFPTGNYYDYAPDAFGRATQIVSGSGKVILNDIAYHPDGQPSAITNPGGAYLRTRLDFGYPDMVRTKPNYSGYHGQTYSYDNSGNVINREYLGVSGIEDMFTYDANSRLLTANGPRIGNWVFTYDHRDNIDHYTQNGALTDFHYDTNNRLSAVGNNAVSYDDRDNITNFDGLWSGFNTANQIYQDGNGHAYLYDGLGLRVYEQYGGSNFIDYTFYDRDGVLRYRHGKQYDIHSEYHTVNGQLFARRDIGSGSTGGSGSGGTPTCQSDSSDPDGDGWGWENGASCIVDSSSSGGGSSGGSGSGGTPTCQSDSSDPDGDGWGWENGASCIVDSSSGGGSGGGGTPTCQSASSDPDGDGWGWENGASCIVP